MIFPSQAGLSPGPFQISWQFPRLNQTLELIIFRFSFTNFSSSKVLEQLSTAWGLTPLISLITRST